ncbi:hypothetical protein OSB04_007761 [Centaurea solstitialis]|uniref:Retroviral polymerase SH3-like domain-containing protein n=1 Tax=Centaurea solstitialis TaxID=347529 RepID=A0AA38TW00_9ASTR|nr:hypothetical protein OSB04_007761 [Centaurea solstitialis]
MKTKGGGQYLKGEIRARFAIARRHSRGAKHLGQTLDFELGELGSAKLESSRTLKGYWIEIVQFSPILSPPHSPFTSYKNVPNRASSLCYDINSKTIILSRHVVFDETNFPFSQSSSPPKTAPPPLSSDPHPLLWSGSTPSVATTPLLLRPQLPPKQPFRHLRCKHTPIDLDKPHLLRQLHHRFPRQRTLWCLPHQHHQYPLLELFIPVACRVSQNPVNHLTFTHLPPYLLFLETLWMLLKTGLEQSHDRRIPGPYR